MSASDGAPTTVAAAPDCAVHEPPKVHNRSEVRTRLVLGVSAVMMVAELIAGYLTNSLALMADGWHMATHVGALGLTAIAYWYARTRSREKRFAFGTGKIYALAGYTSTVLLVVVACDITIESIHRFISKEAVDFSDALPVAIVGLVVNLVSAFLLDLRDNKNDPNVHKHEHHDHAHDHSHDHSHVGHHHAHDHVGHDHNLRAAYLHVVADAMTSLLAIGALLAGRYLNLWWLDPAVAIMAAIVILRWGVGLLRDSASQLIDLGPSVELRERVKGALEGMGGGTQVLDLHLWRVSPKTLACVVTVRSAAPRSLEEYKKAARAAAPIDHLTIEVAETAA